MCIPCGPRHGGYNRTKADDFCYDVRFEVTCKEMEDHFEELNQKEPEIEKQIEEFIRANCGLSLLKLLQKMFDKDKYLCRYYSTNSYKFTGLYKELHAKYKEEKNKKN